MRRSPAIKSGSLHMRILIDRRRLFRTHQNCLLAVLEVHGGSQLLLAQPAMQHHHQIQRRSKRPLQLVPSLNEAHKHGDQERKSGEFNITSRLQHEINGVSMYPLVNFATFQPMREAQSEVESQHSLSVGEVSVNLPRISRFSVLLQTDKYHHLFADYFSF
jgi:hypothetical protein